MHRLSRTILAKSWDHFRSYKTKQKLVVLGGGWFDALSLTFRSGFRLIKDIDLNHYDVTVISPRNHFLFTPLLASASVGTLEFRDITEPLGGVRDSESYRYLNASVKMIDKVKQSVECNTDYNSAEPSFQVGYDKLVVAVGCDVNTFGIPGVQEHALFLKELRDARWIRERIIECFEHASSPNVSLQERERLLRFCIVGAGPTGIESAAEIHDFIHQDLKKLFPSLYMDVKITVIEQASSVLGAFDRNLQEYCQRHFARQNIKIKVNTQVQALEKNAVILGDGSRVECGFVLWSAGIQPRKLLSLEERSPGFKKDKKHRLIVDQNLQVLESDGVYAMGDCSTIQAKDLAQTAQVAQQQGKYLSKKLNYEAKFNSPYPEPFVYQHFGKMAYLGSYRAVFDADNTKIKGFLSWFFWRSVYLTKTVSLKNKLLIPINWLKTMLFGRDITKF